MSLLKSRVGVLFDLDGVLIDSCHFHWMSWKKLQENVPEFNTNYEEFLETFGKRNDEILRDKIKNASEEKINEWSELKEFYFRDFCRGKIGLLDGMKNFLDQLERLSCPKIIASSTLISNLTFFINETVLGEYFDSFVSAEEVPLGKPAPDVFLEAAKRINIPVNNCIAIEDSPAGLLSAKKAGTFVVGLETTHSKKDLTNYDIIYKNPKLLDIVSVLEKFDKCQNKLKERTFGTVRS